MPEPTEHRSFNTFLATLEDGDLHEELTDAVRDLVTALNDQMIELGGKPKGEIVLKLGFKLDSGIVEVTADVKTKLPPKPHRKTALWATPDNNLTRSNPKQRELPLRDVAGGHAETRTA